VIKRAWLLGVPVLLAATVWFGGRAPAVTPSADPATMWLAAPTGRLVRANGLVGSSPAQIVESVDFAAARAGVRLLPTAHALVVVAADGALISVDPRTRRVTATAPAAGPRVETDGAQIFRVRGDDVTVLDPATLRPLAVHRLGGVTARAAVPGALFVTTASGDIRRVTYPSDDVATVANLGPVRPAAFAAAPDGRSFALLDGRQLRVITDGREARQDLAFAPGETLVLDGGVAYVGDPAAGSIHRFRAGAALAEEPALAVGRSMRLDVHRNRQFVWFDDVRGPVAWAVHEGQPRKIDKFRVRRPAPAPSTSPPPASPPPTSPPPTSPPPPPSKERFRPTPPLKKPQTKKPLTKKDPPPARKPEPSPSPTGDPLARCGGRPTAVRVSNPANPGTHPKVTVTVCEKATGGAQYWIMSRTEGLWYAKLRIATSGTYTVELLHGAGADGEQRDFLIVAGRTADARTWLTANHLADVKDREFTRDSLPDGIDEVSDRVPTES
jgi:hypothetical protein